MINIYNIEVAINKDDFIEVIHAKGSSIRQLGKVVGKTEKTIRNYLNSGKMPLEIFVRCLNELGIDNPDMVLVPTII